MKYSPLVIIKLKHSFYDHGECPDFFIDPDAQTIRLLSNHRCVIKANTYGLTIYVPIENQQPLIGFADTTKFVFDFKLKTSDFAQFTDQCLQLSNPAAITLFQKGLNVNPQQGIVTTCGVNEPLLRVAIQRDFNQIMVNPAADEIRFFAKPVFWFYYLLTDQNNSDQFAIVDISQDIPKSTWQRQEPLPGNNISTQLVERFPAMNIVCFVCDQIQDCREFPTRNLQLKQGEDTIFEHLPCPDYRNYLRVPGNGSSKSTDANYEIVKYLTNTTLFKG
jgi:hypothetical protein